MSSRSAAAVRRLKVSSASKLVELVVPVLRAGQEPFRCDEDQKEARRWQNAMVRIRVDVFDLGEAVQISRAVYRT
jgi:hypothetical protein